MSTMLASDVRQEVTLRFTFPQSSLSHNLRTFPATLESLDRVLRSFIILDFVIDEIRPNDTVAGVKSLTAFVINGRRTSLRISNDLVRMHYESPWEVVVAFIATHATALAMVRLIRDWSTHRRIEAARADREENLTRLHTALADRLMSEVQAPHLDWNSESDRLQLQNAVRAVADLGAMHRIAEMAPQIEEVER